MWCTLLEDSLYHGSLNGARRTLGEMFTSSPVSGCEHSMQVWEPNLRLMKTLPNRHLRTHRTQEEQDKGVAGTGRGQHFPRPHFPLIAFQNRKTFWYLPRLLGRASKL